MWPINLFAFLEQQKYIYSLYSSIGSVLGLWYCDLNHVFVILAILNLSKYVGIYNIRYNYWIIINFNYRYSNRIEELLKLIDNMACLLLPVEGGLSSVSAISVGQRNFLGLYLSVSTGSPRYLQYRYIMIVNCVLERRFDYSSCI